MRIGQKDNAMFLELDPARMFLFIAPKQMESFRSREKFWVYAEDSSAASFLVDSSKSHLCKPKSVNLYTFYNNGFATINLYCLHFKAPSVFRFMPKVKTDSMVSILSQPLTI